MVLGVNIDQLENRGVSPEALRVSVFGAIHLVPDEEREVLTMVAISAARPTATHLSELSRNDPRARWVRARDVCGQEGLSWHLRRTRRGDQAVSVELELRRADLKGQSGEAGRIRSQLPREQLESFATSIGRVSAALQAVDVEKKQGGCYIATAVYGSYEAPQVLALRRYRDESLLTSAAGRTLVKTYYALSPSIAQKLQEARRANRVARAVLDIVVSWLDRR
jgi:hypothetical protein